MSFVLIHAFFKEADIIAGILEVILFVPYGLGKKAKMTMNNVKEIEHLEGCEILYCIYCSHNSHKKIK